MFDQTSYQSYSGAIVKFGPTEGDFATPIRASVLTLSKDAPIKVGLLDMNAAVAKTVREIYSKHYDAYLVDPMQCSAHRWCCFADGRAKEVWEVWTRVRKKNGKWYFGVNIQFECERLPTNYRDERMTSKFLVWEVHEDHSMENMRAD